MRLHLIRHGAVTVRPDVPGPDWRLSPEGRAAIDALAQEPGWDALSRLYTSPEPKAVATAQRLAGPNDLPIGIERDLREVEGRAWLEEGYADQARRYLARGAAEGWEQRADALARVRSCIDTIVSGSGERDAGVVSHGLVLTLYLADVLGLDADASSELWNSIRFPDVCIIDRETRAVVRPFGSAA